MPLPCTRRKEKQNKMSREKHRKDMERKVNSCGQAQCGSPSLFWVFVNVRASEAWARQWASWCMCLCRLQEGEPSVTEGEWQGSVSLAYHPTISAIYSVLLTRSPTPATKQKHSPAFVLKRPQALTAMRVIWDIFQLICRHLGRASHKHGIDHIFHWLGTPECYNPMFQKNCLSFCY